MVLVLKVMEDTTYDMETEVTSNYHLIDTLHTTHNPAGIVIIENIEMNDYPPAKAHCFVHIKSASLYQQALEFSGI